MRQPEPIRLPLPKHTGNVSLEDAILNRRSFRRYKDEPLTVVEVSQLLWAAQGITRPERRLRAAPSAGARYPLETYVVAGNVDGLATGFYKYKPDRHELERYLDTDIRIDLNAACLGQGMVARSAASVVFTAVYERATSRYGERGIRYVHMDVGHAGENLFLQAVALGLGTVIVGAFDDDDVKRVLSLPGDEQPLYVMPVGRV